MNKSIGFILLLLMFTNTMNAELANGKIEEFFIKNGKEERNIRIYYPNNNSVDDDTTFIIMNDGEELFLERDSWRGRTWRIDKSFDELAKINKAPNVIIIAVQSAKKYKGKFFDNTRRYLELFPKEAIKFLPEGNKKKIYGSLADTDYPKFLVESVVPFVEGKFEINLDKNNLGVIGSSMGGLSALNTIVEYPDEFGFAGCLSTHWIGIKPWEYLLLPIRQRISGDQDTIDAIYEYVKKNISTIQNHKVYFDRGTRGLDYLYKEPQESVDKLFFDNNINFETQVYKGHDHDPVDFGKRFIPAIEFLL